MQSRMISRVWLTAVAVFACPFMQGDASAAMIVSQQDAMVVNGAPDTNFGTDRVATATAYMSQQFVRSYLKFPLAGMPDLSQVQSATLHMYQYDAGGFVPIINLYHVTDDTWTELGITWNNRPLPIPLPADLLATQDIGFDVGWKSIDLLSSGVWDYDADVSDGMLSLLLRSNENGDERHNFYSRDEDIPGDYRPYLEILVIPEPASLSLLAIGGVALIRRR